MKKVWVNRFNSDGSVKPMSEWVQVSCDNDAKHVVIFNLNSLDFEAVNEASMPAKNLVVAGSMYEYIGDQRGDGWFYVADGHLPLFWVRVLVMNGNEEIYMDHLSRIGFYYGEIICWQSIMQPQK